MGLDYVVISGTIRSRLMLGNLDRHKQEEMYGFRYHSYYTAIQGKNGIVLDTGWLYKVTDEKRLLLAAIEHGIQFYKTYET
jgi:hypothetical protein